MAINIIQHGLNNYNQGSTGNSVSVTYASNVVSTNTLIAIINTDGNSSGISVSDNQNGSWIIDAGPITLSGTGDHFYLARLQSTVGGVAPIVTASWTVSTGNKILSLFEVSGLQSNPYSQPTPNTSGSYYDGSPETAPLLQVTPANAPLLILAILGTAIIPTNYGITAGFTNEYQSNGWLNGTISSMSLITINTNIITIDATPASNGGWGIIVGTYLGISGGGIPILINQYRQRRIQ